MSDKVFVPNSFQTPNVLVDEAMAVVSGAAFKILMAITRYLLGYHCHGGVQIGHGALKSLTGLSHQSIINGSEELAKLGLIGIKKGPRSSGIENTYFLNLDLITGELLKKVECSKKLSRGSSQKSRLLVLKKVDSLKIINKKNKDKSDANASLPPNSSGSQTPNLKKKRERGVAGAVPDELKPVVARVIARLNELASTSYAPDSKIVVDGLVRRLKAGAAESDCLAVVENQWREWGDDPEMRKYFNPETLFRESKFEKYKNAALMGQPKQAKRFWA